MSYPTQDHVPDLIPGTTSCNQDHRKTCQYELTSIVNRLLVYEIDRFYITRTGIALTLHGSTDSHFGRQIAESVVHDFSGTLSVSNEIQVY